MNASMDLSQNVTVPFSRKVIAWQRRHGRRGLPWQGTRDPYRVWLSEVMLQQTQVAAVIPYYRRFLEKYPTVESLAAAREDDVLRLWSGLGYYARGRNLRLAATAIVEQGGFPDTPEALAALPGVGRSTAAAIAVFAFGRRAAILDGNVKRVLSRVFAVEREADLWPLAERLLPKRSLETYTQALMDLGSLVCTRGTPRCDACPVASQCVARREKRVHELPRRRAKGVVPLRKATWFVYLHDRQVLLERRPSRGVWGGLWTFPEARKGRVRGERLPVVEHGFTHFRLLAQPLLHRVAKRFATPGGLWLDLADAAGAALPAPVRKLLLTL
jgi:A/G-specific adenine glycosylase